ncbi:MAG: TRAP transporter fused permease subunit [Thioalkalivibrio sp.]|nr:MAG: TRAP transporter fused permease subunit [Thioalkalivibrio sp.]
METGARRPGSTTRTLIYLTALAWSLFQLWIVSPLPYTLAFGVIPETQARSIHLAFAVFLAFLLFPARLPSARGPHIAAGFYGLLGLGLWILAWQQHQAEQPWVTVYLLMGAAALVLAWPAWRVAPLERIPWIDWLLGLTAAFAAGYLFLFHQDLAQRPGRPELPDMIAAGLGLLLLLEATRRVLGPALMVIAGVFLIYTFAGPWMPDLLAHRGASFGRAMSQQWLSNEGVFGIALGVSTSFVFLFVLFGALLEKAGAGGYFIRVAFSLLGHMRGGPAKAAVVASGLTGVVSGSSIANVVTTGTFTVPLMKRTGLTSSKAGAVEVASSVNGQLMPPVMGAAAFLMVEYVGIPYVEVIKHAFLPALIAYIALLYIVHLEALKAGLQGLPRHRPSRLSRSLIGLGLSVSGLLVLAGLVYYGLGWVKDVAGDQSFWVIGALVGVAYLLLLWLTCRVPDPGPELDPDITEVPDPGPTIQGGLHFLLPVVVLVWALVVERLSPGLSAFWAVLFLVGILLTQRPLVVLFRGLDGYGPAFLRGLRELSDGMVQGARNMIGIGVATAAAGIIVGTVAMTGIGLVMTDLVELLSGGNLMLMLMLTAVICLVLGLGLPTTANYIIVATLMAPVIVDLGAQNELLIPLIAAHLFVFYFGIMADVTPPVGLASFAAAAVARADPIRTGLQAFWYSLRTVTLPFVFMFNTQLLLIGVDSLWQLALTFFGSLAGILVFAAATQHFFLVRNRLWETAVMLLVALTLLVPGVWMDRLHEPLQALPPTEIEAVAEDQPAGDHLRLEISSYDLDGQEVVRRVMLPLGDPAPGQERLSAAGLGLMIFGDQVNISFVGFSSPAERAGIEGGSQVTAVFVPADRPAPEWFFLPALLVLGFVAWVQRRRRALRI